MGRPKGGKNKEISDEVVIEENNDLEIEKIQ